jgi:hypothetical protein
MFEWERDIFLKAVTPDCEQEKLSVGRGKLAFLSASQLRLRLRAERANFASVKGR